MFTEKGILIVPFSVTDTFQNVNCIGGNMEKYSAINKVGLIPRKVNPDNFESPVNAINSWITPNHLFFIRCHLPYPDLSLETWTLTLNGEVNTSKSISYNELIKMPHISKDVIIECSGNKRGLMEPPASGNQFEMGTIGNAKWTGVPLSFVLELADIKDNVKEIIFSGLDKGFRPDMPQELNFIRSLPNDKNLLNECILALYMNDVPLPFEHGFPLRLIVPGWHGMAHVKWLSHITASSSQFKGPFQTVDYVYINNEDDYSNAVPVTENKVNSIISWPGKGEIIKPGQYIIKGIAWTGGNRTVQKVQVSTDNGTNWSDAQLTSPEHKPYTWTFWEFTWNISQPGHYSVLARAVDSLGNMQPKHAAWNAKGYSNNSIHKIDVVVPVQRS
jgi:sulfite oxidase